MESVGEQFKQRRKELNLSLKEAENATSIRMHYLQALEENDMSKLISPVYAQGFAKQYATFLGMDGDRLIREHSDLFARPFQGGEFSFGIGTLEMRGNPSNGIKWLPNLLWAAAILGIFLLAWLFARFLDVL